MCEGIGKQGYMMFVKANTVKEKIMYEMINIRLDFLAQSRPTFCSEKGELSSLDARCRGHLHTLPHTQAGCAVCLSPRRPFRAHDGICILAMEGDG